MSAIKRIIVQQSAQRAGPAGFFSRFGRKNRKRSAKKEPHKGGKTKLRKTFANAAAIGVAVILAGSVGFLGLFAWYAKDLPDPDKVSQRSIAQTTRIFDRTGEVVLYEIHGDQKRTVVELDDMSQYVKDATIASEDKDFYSHKGFDLKGFLRAIMKNLLKGQRVQGGSTITQQFIKNSVLTPEKTYTRKLKELVLSIETERRFTKDQILKLYLNEIPYGSVAYGIESAAQTFFEKSSKDLTLPESALLSALPKAPTYYSPYGTHTDELMARTHMILDAMVTEGYITEEEASLAKEDDLLSRIQPRREGITAPHFVLYVKELLANEFGENMVERGGLTVITTLDAEKQELAEKVIGEKRETIEEWGGKTAALLALDPARGDILAMVGSADYFDEDINGNFNAILGKIQPGSSIKPFVYAALFEKGFTPDTVLYDTLTDFDAGAETYEPKNYDLKEYGSVTVREAFAGSLNIPAVKALYLTGIDYFVEFAKRFGYTTLDDRSKFGLSLVLGGAEVKPIEHISAFSAFAREGMYAPPRAILKVEDVDGRVIIGNEDPVTGKRVLEKEIVRQINSILSDNAARAYAFGESNYLTLGERPACAKTGTTNGYKDAWTIGYTPSFVAGVWVGNAEGGEMKLGASGSVVAAPLWNSFMRQALYGTRVESFTAPLPVVTGKPVLDGDKGAQVKVRVDSVTGKLATEHTPEYLVEERGYGVPHSILYFVDPDDPRGPEPENPEADPQFRGWEDSVARWAEGQDIVTKPPPTEYDDVHVPENIPSISIISPYEAATVTDRSFRVTVNATARRGIAKVEYYMDDELIGTNTSYPFHGLVTVPNRFPKGFHVFGAKAYDDVGNRTYTYITINLNAEAGPLGAQWLYPRDYQGVSRASGFPLTVKFRIEDQKSVERLRLYARDDSGTEYAIGSIENPLLPNVSMQWTDAPASYGRFELILEAELVTGDVRTESIAITVL